MWTDPPTPVAHRDELPEPGSFVTTDVRGTPVLVVRQDDGTIAVFTNVCRHRGARVETAAAGRRKMFSCPYHRWCYARDGGIRSMPFDDGFVGVDRVDRSLLRLSAAEHAGLVWTATAPRLDWGDTRLVRAEHAEVDRPVSEVHAELPAGWDEAGLRVTERGPHLEVRSVRPAGPRLATTATDLWVLALD
ncbi:Rieske (2Fe-2S) protein [Pseudonocardia xishanensis]|uniref:Rieske domain-containing protein n=1 Tax=Pseudonocardia xishanensis TaxID=630995 RepID=A0ABP8RTQ9_9PSEU